MLQIGLPPCGLLGKETFPPESLQETIAGRALRTELFTLFSWAFFLELLILTRIAPAKIAMIATTMRISIRVNPRFLFIKKFIALNFTSPAPVLNLKTGAELANPPG